MWPNYSQFLVNILHLPILVGLRKHLLHGSVADWLHQVLVHWHLNHLNPRLLPGLTRLNAMDALLRNALVLQIPVEYLETDDHDSMFYSPRLPRQQALPTDLSPTALQNAVTHHSWLDHFPMPGSRDNMLRGISTGELDEAQLSDELCCDLLRLDAMSTAALMIWGEAWDASSWEFSPDFSRDGAICLRDVTKYWRLPTAGGSSVAR
jgi:hypothetical protein